VPQGPADTPFEGGTFELLLNVPEQYPLVPPSVRYRTKIFHPNVHFKVRTLLARAVSVNLQALLVLLQAILLHCAVICSVPHIQVTCNGCCYMENVHKSNASMYFLWV